MNDLLRIEPRRQSTPEGAFNFRSMFEANSFENLFAKYNLVLVDANFKYCMT